jgi:hypothetical protein
MVANNYRLYIDESGTHNYCTCESITKKYLCLCGIIIDSQTTEKILNPYFFELKQYIANDKDSFPVFHREDIAGYHGCFRKLKQSDIKQKWKDKILWIFENLDYTICGIVLNKKNHLLRYEKSAMHPYHYCLNMLLERYVCFLSSISSRGDVVAETRGKVEDKALEKAFEDFYKYGTYYSSTNSINRRLTSKRIKIKSKGQGYWGLELSDLLALAVKLDVLYTYKQIGILDDNFNLEIIKTIQTKYRKNNEEKVIGFGKKLIE